MANPMGRLGGDCAETGQTVGSRSSTLRSAATAVVLAAANTLTSNGATHADTASHTAAQQHPPGSLLEEIGAGADPASDAAAE